jgi:hypothetical protein
MNILARLLFICLLPALAGAAVPELGQQARQLLDEFEVRCRARDIKAVAELLSDDATVVMTSPSQGATAVRFYTKEIYLQQLHERLVSKVETKLTRTIRIVIAYETTGYVLVSSETEEQTLIEQRHEWIKTNDYVVMVLSNGKLKIRQIVTELIAYTPDFKLRPIEK